MSDATPRASPGTAGASAIAFLRQFPPFNQMSADDLASIAAQLALAYYPKGAIVLAPEHGEPPFLYIVQRGTVRRTSAENADAAAGDGMALGRGECFSVSALLERRPSTASYVAVADTFCYQLESRHFHDLLHRSPPFQDFATGYLTSLLRESRRLLRMEKSSSAGERQAMNRTLRSMVRRTPVTCGPDAPIRDALATMQREKTGSIIIVSPDNRAMGIFTRHDVLDRVALASIDTAQPISTVMSAPASTLTADATAYDAALAMARLGIRHVPVVEERQVMGVVTERDLFALQRVSMRRINRSILNADDISALQQAAADIRRLATDLIHQGVAAGQLTQILSTLNDAVTRRLIDIEAGRHDLGGIRWCWLAFGSEGRLEQTLASDQDNGLIFETIEGVTDDALRQRLLPFARNANAALDACGFPLCQGDIMAGNPRWCLSLGEWRSQFSSWVQDSKPEALLNATIFFDLRALRGSENLVEALRGHLFELVRRNDRFLRLMAQQALDIRPPLGLLRDFVVQDDGDHAGTLDLKHRGSRLFVDAARVIGPAAAVTQANTEQRLRHGGARLNMTPAEIDAMIEAFQFIQHLRLLGTEGVEPNRVNPDGLNEVDRRILKESFRQARKLQTRLALDYRL